MREERLVVPAPRSARERARPARRGAPARRPAAPASSRDRAAAAVRAGPGHPLPPALHQARPRGVHLAPRHHAPACSACFRRAGVDDAATRGLPPQARHALRPGARRSACRPRRAVRRALDGERRRRRAARAAEPGRARGDAVPRRRAASATASPGWPSCIAAADFLIALLTADAGARGRGGALPRPRRGWRWLRGDGEIDARAPVLSLRVVGPGAFARALEWRERPMLEARVRVLRWRALGPSVGAGAGAWPRGRGDRAAWGFSARGRPVALASCRPGPGRPGDDPRWRYGGPRRARRGCRGGRMCGGGCGRGDHAITVRPGAWCRPS